MLALGVVAAVLALSVVVVVLAAGAVLALGVVAAVLAAGAVLALGVVAAVLAADDIGFVGILKLAEAFGVVDVLASTLRLTCAFPFFCCGGTGFAFFCDAISALGFLLFCWWAAGFAWLLNNGDAFDTITTSMFLLGPVVGCMDGPDAGADAEPLFDAIKAPHSTTHTMLVTSRVTNAPSIAPIYPSATNTLSPFSCSTWRIRPPAAFSALELVSRVPRAL